MNHPNRSKLRNLPGATPTPDLIRALREGAGMTRREFAKAGFYSELACEQWEDGSRQMHPLIWMAYKHMLGKQELLKITEKEFINEKH